MANREDTSYYSKSAGIREKAVEVRLIPPGNKHRFF